MRRLVSRSKTRGLCQVWTNDAAMSSTFLETQWLYWNGPGTWDQFTEPMQGNLADLAFRFDSTASKVAAWNRHSGLRSLELRVQERTLRLWGLDKPHQTRTREWQLSFSLLAPGPGLVLRTIGYRGKDFPLKWIHDWIHLLMASPLLERQTPLPWPIFFRGELLALFLEPVWEQSQKRLAELGQWKNFDSIGPNLSHKIALQEHPLPLSERDKHSNTETPFAQTGPLSVAAERSQSETTLSQGENPEMAQLTQAYEAESNLELAFPDAASLRALLPSAVHFFPNQLHAQPIQPWHALYYHSDTQDLLCYRYNGGQQLYARFQLPLPLHRMIKQLFFTGPNRTLFLKDTQYYLPDAFLTGQS